MYQLINWTDVTNDVVADAIVDMVRWLAGSVGGLRDLKYKKNVDIVRWLDTELLIKPFITRESLHSHVPALQALNPEAQENLAIVLRSPETEAALQALLAARLAGETASHADAACTALRDALLAGDPDSGSLANSLVSCLDAEIKRIVAQLRHRKPELLTQIRRDATAMQMLNTLRAVERYLKALDAPPSPERISEFLAKYRVKVDDTFGMIGLPDDRSRGVSLDEIYVRTPLFEYANLADLETWPESASEADLEKVGKFVRRAVLFGDPGNGKTTAARFLMHRFAGSQPSSPEASRVPFFVELRKYVAGTRLEAFVEYIDRDLRDNYESTLPAGLVELLLRRKRAMVIFDGLDEVLDVNVRRQVAAHIASFCTEYPQARVLVTTRITGYEQAPLSDREFQYFRLGRFGEDQVTDYAERWFRIVRDDAPGLVERFIRQSASFPELRSNPLLLSLMCALYRNSWSLPAERAELYRRCADNLIYEWDNSRGINSPMRAGLPVREILANLAWWIYRHAKNQYAVTEQVLVAQARKFLMEQGANSLDEANDAARKFVKFCQGRAWMFVEADRSDSGERRYEFRHRTFLEYFTARYLAGSYQSRVGFSRYLLKNIPVRDDLWPIADLAIQIMNDNASGTALNQIYKTMLAEVGGLPPQARTAVLRFLVSRHSAARKLNLAQVRQLTSDFLSDGIADDDIRGATPEWMRALRELLEHGPDATIADEMGGLLDELIGGGSAAARSNSLWFAASLRNSRVIPHSLSLTDTRRSADFWVKYLTDFLQAHPAEVTASAADVRYLRHAALELELISAVQALKLPGGLSALLQTPTSYFPGDYEIEPYLQLACVALLIGFPAIADPHVVARLESVGEYLASHPGLPWLRGSLDVQPESATVLAGGTAAPADDLSASAYLGAAALLALLTECTPEYTADREAWPPPLGPVADLAPYLTRRVSRGNAGTEKGGPDGRGTVLAPLPVTAGFEQVFRDWADGTIDIAARDSA
jgi:NACHT domain